MKNSIKLMLAAVICALGFISTLQAQEYQKGFRLGFGLNTGYLTGDEYSVELGQMHDFNMMCLKDILSIYYRVYTLF